MINQTPDKKLLDQITDMLRRLDERVDQLESLEPAPWTMIEDVEVGVAGIGVFDFQDIPASFKHLFILVSARLDRVATSGSINARFNADGAANYDYIRFVINHSGVLSTAEGIAIGSMPTQLIAAASAPANYFDIAEYFIPDYLDTNKFKELSSTGNTLLAQSTGSLRFNGGSGWWRDTDAINRIQLTAGGNNFIEHSRATLYGIR